MIRLARMPFFKICALTLQVAFIAITCVPPAVAQGERDELDDLYREIFRWKELRRFELANRAAEDVIGFCMPKYELHKRAYRELIETHAEMGDNEAVREVTTGAYRKFATLEPQSAAKGETRDHELLLEARDLRANRKFEEAVEKIDSVLVESEFYYRRMEQTCNERVYLIKNYKQPEFEARVAAEEALKLFPAMRDDYYGDRDLNDLYDEIRTSLYGTVEVTTKPDNCRIFVDDELRGLSALRAEFIRVGPHELRFEKPGRRTVRDSVVVEPKLPTRVDKELPRAGLTPWLVVPAHVLLTALVIVTVGIVAQRGEEKPLPEPPDPPGN